MKKSTLLVLSCAVLAPLSYTYYVRASTPSTAECLGYQATDKVLVINADDLGMHPDLDAAILDMYEKGAITSMSVMAPAPSFHQAMAQVKEKGFKVGVHLTMTNEWQSAHPWGGVLPKEQTPSLHNKDGYLYPTSDLVGKLAKPEEAEKELRAQIEAILAYDVPVTHIDAHMFFWYYNPELIKIVRSLAKEYDLPLVEQSWKTKPEQLKQSKVYKANGLLVEDSYSIIYDLDIATNHPDKLYQQYLNLVDELPAGFHHIAIHPGWVTDQSLQDISDIKLRRADYDAWLHPKMLDRLKSFKLTDFSDIKVKQQAYYQGIDACQS